MPKNIILVDNRDISIGTADKMAVHKNGQLHRAFSIFVFNNTGEMLLQKRALTKYHSRGLWTNTCCSHPRPGETTSAAARRRLQEEMGFTCQLTEAFSFTYQTAFTNKLTEYEYDHVFIGTFSGTPHPDPTEAAGWKWVFPAWLKTDLKRHPKHYTVWLKVCLDRVLAHPL